MRLADLSPASFRGVPFLVPKDRAKEGRNTIVHEYPDASHRYAEDNGRILPSFRITAVLHGAGLPGKLNRLRSALTRPGPGTLKHPYLGAQFCAVDGEYEIEREDTDSGVIVLDIPFVVTGPPAFPGLVSGVAAVVGGLAGSFVTSLFDAFSQQWGDPRSAVSRSVLATAVIDIAATAADRFGSGTTSALRVAIDAGGLVSEPARFGSRFSAVFREPFLADEIDDVTLVRGFNAISDVAEGVAAQAAAIKPTTLDLVERQASLALLADAARAAAFAGLAQAMADRAYTTAEQVAADEQVLAVRFDAVQAGGLDGESHLALAAIYTAAADVLRDREVRLPRLATLDVIEFPASVLAYQLYDGDARQPDLVSINRERNPILYDGPVTVLAIDGGNA